MRISPFLLIDMLGEGVRPVWFNDRVAVPGKEARGKWENSLYVGILDLYLKAQQLSLDNETVADHFIPVFSGDNIELVCHFEPSIFERS